jgi:glucan phosphoethanolaminetransferase (alkaline phosphatase superfamily)
MCRKIFVTWAVGLLLVCCMPEIIYAASSTRQYSLGVISGNITGVFTFVTMFMQAGVYLVAIAFAMGALWKFFEYRKNPVQTPLSYPIFLLIFALAFAALPFTAQLTGYDFLLEQKASQKKTTTQSSS